jgi:hypothetical protein
MSETLEKWLFLFWSSGRDVGPNHTAAEAFGPMAIHFSVRVQRCENFSVLLGRKVSLVSIDTSSKLTWRRSGKVSVNCQPDSQGRRFGLKVRSEVIQKIAGYHE